jgi:hypothetical protein
MQKQIAIRKEKQEEAKLLIGRDHSVRENTDDEIDEYERHADEYRQSSHHG